MKHKKRIKITAALVCMVILSLFTFLRPQEQVKADSANKGVSTALAATTKSKDSLLGTLENPFTVLEIVPNQSMGKVGYLIPGCEPIDMTKLEVDKNNLIGTYQSNFCGSDSGIATYVTDTTQLFLDQLIEQNPTGVVVDSYDQYFFSNVAQPSQLTVDQSLTGQVCGVWHMRYTPLEQSGYYQFVAGGTGSFTLTMNSDGLTGTFAYTGANTGNYNWVQAENTAGIITDYQSDTVWTKRSAMAYYEYQKYTFTNTDLLVQSAFGTTSDLFHTQVITLTPNALGSAEALSLIDTAELIIIQGDTETGVSDLWKAYHRDEVVLPTEYPTGFNTSNDLPWEATMRILNRQASTNPAALVLDQARMLPQESSSSNMSKLYRMLIQYGPNVFQQNFAPLLTTVSDNGRMTGAYKGNITWNNSTFLDESLGTSIMQVPYLPTGSAIITDQIYSYNGMNILPHNYVAPTINKGQSNVSPLFEYLTIKNEDGTTTTPDFANTNQVISFLLQGKSYKNSLNILEIEACKDFYADDSNWKLYLSTLIPWFNGDVTDENLVKVTKMPVWELNGDISDLTASYDMILIGDKQNAGNGSTGYNDTSLNGLVYTAVGDLSYNTSSNLSTKTRYSPNDITQKKLNELKDFAQANKPVVFLGNLFTGNGANAGKMDISSKVYELASLRGSIAVFAKVLDSANTISSSLAIQTCQLEFFAADGATGYPTEYKYDKTSEGLITNVSYNASNTFTYHFKVAGPTGAQYYVKLFIDQDGDGVYDGSAKEVEKQIKLGITPTYAEEITGLSIVDDQSKKTVSIIEANTYYTVTRTLPSNFAGILPWKLEVVNTANDKLRDSEINYSAIKAKEDAKEEIRVLQMNLSYDMKQEASTNFSQNATWGSVFLNFADTTTATGAKFDKYLSCVDEFDISLTFQKNVDWYKKYGEKATDSLGNELTEAQRIAAWKQELDTYDMLILGFNDMCMFTGNKVYYEGFTYFRDQGKSIIMSHDMVMPGNLYTNRPTFYASYVSDLRTMVGQRKRYTDINGNLSYAKSVSAGKEVDLLPNSTILNTTLTQNNLNYFVFKTMMLNPVTGEKNLVSSEYPDNANYIHSIDGVNSFASLPKSDRTYTTTKTSYSWTGSYETTSVGVANKGQITEYPYKIPDAITIQKTHTQYFSLDLESVVDGDAVVWYNLTDNKSSRYGKTLNSTQTLNDSGLYSSRDVDSANNFYIYNKGNITYTGLGHGAVGSSTSVSHVLKDNGLPDDEVKLFVNTMIAAYRSSADKPTILVTSPEASENNNSETIMYVTLDSANISDEGKVIPVNYQINDDSFSEVNGRTYQMQYMDTTGEVDNRKTYVSASGQEIELTNNSYYTLQRGVEYKFEVPYKDIISKGQVEVDLMLTSTYINNRNEMVTTISSKRVIILPLPLFKLS